MPSLLQAVPAIRSGAITTRQPAGLPLYALIAADGGALP
jgi:hypothetical protein